jgi:hypothetical protein
VAGLLSGRLAFWLAGFLDSDAIAMVGLKAGDATAGDATAALAVIVYSLTLAY